MNLNRKGFEKGEIAPYWCPCQGNCGFTCATGCSGCLGTCFTSMCKKSNLM